MFKYAFVCAFVLAGCASSPVLDNAAKLGSAGQAASDAMVDYVDAMANGYQGYLDGLSFAGQYPPPPSRDQVPPKGKAPADAPPPCNIHDLHPLGADGRQNADDYFDRLDKTRAFFTQLSNTYAAFGALAAYDANTAVQTNLEGMVATANGLLGKLKEPGIPDKAGAFAAAAGGMFVRHEQEDAVKAASRNVRAVVERVTAALKSHRGTFVDARAEEVKVSWYVADTMWCAGILDVRPVFAPLLQDTGLSAAAPLPPNDAALKIGVKDLLTAHAKRARAHVGDGFDRITAGLDALIVEHNKLEANGLVDVGRLAVLAAGLKRLVDSGAAGTDK
jgi:hypothetical protein